VGLFCKVVAIILVVVWPAVTSRSLLTHGGIIHVVHSDHAHDDHEHHDGEGSHEHNGDNHTVADGEYRSTSSGKFVIKPPLAAAIALIASNAALEQRGEWLAHSAGAAPPGSTPQILQQTWQFSNRAAIPGRAPSLLS